MVFPALAQATAPGKARGPHLLRWLARDSSGQLLLETVVAISIFGLVGAAVLLGVRVAHNSTSLVENHSIAERLARNQMEYVFDQGFKAVGQSYDSINDAPSLFSVPAGYQVTAVAQQFLVADAYQGSVEKVVVTVSLDGNSVEVLETLRAK